MDLFSPRTCTSGCPGWFAASAKSCPAWWCAPCGLRSQNGLATPGWHTMIVVFEFHVWIEMWRWSWIKVWNWDARLSRGWLMDLCQGAPTPKDANISTDDDYTRTVIEWLANDRKAMVFRPLGMSTKKHESQNLIIMLVQMLMRVRRWTLRMGLTVLQLELPRMSITTEKPSSRTSSLEKKYQVSLSS